MKIEPKKITFIRSYPKLNPQQVNSLNTTANKRVKDYLDNFDYEDSHPRCYPDKMEEEKEYSDLISKALERLDGILPPDELHKLLNIILNGLWPGNQFESLCNTMDKIEEIFPQDKASDLLGKIISKSIQQGTPLFSPLSDFLDSVKDKLTHEEIIYLTEEILNKCVRYLLSTLRNVPVALECKLTLAQIINLFEKMY